MRKSFLGFLVVAMLTPILTCVMAFCPMQTAQAKEQPPCHQSQDGNTASPMFVLECMGVDLFAQDPSNDIQPDHSLDSIDYTKSDLAVDFVFNSKNINAIRGPPFDANPPHLNDHNTYLTTQRFRL